MKRRLLVFAGLMLLAALTLAQLPTLSRPSQAVAAPDIFASPVHGGCYVAGPSDCRLHVEPFTINVASGKKLVRFQLVAIQGGTGTQTIIYDFRPDQSNPVPASGTTFTPSLVMQDYAATCGKSYEISLQGMDSGDSGMYNLGLTALFTCPSGVP